MLKYIEVTAKTEDDAIAKGLKQLGLSRDDVSVEVLDRGRTGFLGIGSVPAKVKLTYETPDEPEPAPEIVPEPRPEPKMPEPKPEPKSAPRQEPRAPKQEQRPRQPAPQGEKKKERRSAPQKPERKQTPPQQPAAGTAEGTGEGGELDPEVVEAIVKFQSGLFEHMGAKVTPTVSRDGEAYQVVLEGENLGALIGHRGETLNAIQQLTNYAVNRGRGHRVRIHVDAEGYRARREESLEKLARKTAAKVVKMHRNVTLEAMNAYERHVIHTALQDYPGVSTFSTGVEPNRRTVVAYDPNKR